MRTGDVSAGLPRFPTGNPCWKPSRYRRPKLVPIKATKRPPPSGRIRFFTVLDDIAQSRTKLDDVLLQASFVREKSCITRGNGRDLSPIEMNLKFARPKSRVKGLVFKVSKENFVACSIALGTLKQLRF